MNVVAVKINLMVFEMDDLLCSRITVLNAFALLLAPLAKHVAACGSMTLWIASGSNILILWRQVVLRTTGGPTCPCGG